MDETTSDEAQAGGRRPSHIAYWIRDRENQKGEWHAIGVAWAHADGKGFNVALDLLPRDGRVALRLLEDKPERSG
jgi:hypothetical protein